MGGVKFEHKLHVERVGNRCETCHHPSKPEKPLKAPQEACMDCHTRPPQPGMKTGLPDAFHNPTAQAGTCIDCHKLQDAAGKNAPLRCTECHKQENTQRGLEGRDGLSQGRVLSPAKRMSWLDTRLPYSRVPEQCLEAVIHMQLVVAVEERQSGLIGHEVHGHPPIIRHYHSVLDNSGCRFPVDLNQFE